MPAASSPNAAPISRGERAQVLSLIGFVALAMVLGGGGVQAPPILAVIVELAALVALAVMLLAAQGVTMHPQARPAAAFVLLVAAVALLQLIPLPASWWRGLPGRAIADQVRTLVGADERWLPLALDPDGARASALALLVPIAAFLCTLHIGARGRLQLLAAIFLLCVVDLLLSMAQAATRGAAGFAPFVTLHTGSALGFFANRNHNADLLLIAPLIGAALLRLRPESGLMPKHKPAIVALLLLFLLAVLVTGSRAGLVLTTMPVLGVLVLFSSRGTTLARPSRGLLVAFTALVALAIGVAVLGATNDVAIRTLQRFEAGTDPRFEFWPDVVYGIGQLWPVGAGLGSFDATFRTVERLEIVDAFFVNHAHNDYFELLFELGLIGAILLALFLILFARAVRTELLDRRGVPLQPVSIAAMFSISVLLLHSLVDYPLRTFALSAVFGVLCALLYGPRQFAQTPPRSAPLS